MSISIKTTEEIDNISEEEGLRVIEAVLFVSGKFLNVQEIVSLSGFNTILVYDFLEKLREKYISSDSAIEIIEKNNLWKMDVKQQYSNMVNKLAGGNTEFSKAEQETLAIIAFKQPIKQSVVIKIRGNKAYDHIKNFTDLGLIRRKKFGHTHELSLSEEFYNYFNLPESERVGEEDD